MQVASNDSYRQAARQLSHVLRTQAKQRHPYAAAADEVELAVYKHLLQQQHRSSLNEPHARTVHNLAQSEAAAEKDAQQREL
jgi:hypothetical protein